MYVGRPGDHKDASTARPSEPARGAPALDLSEVAPVGHYLALRVGFAFPMEEVNALPNSWVEHYTRRSLMLWDPVMRWIYASTGGIRWSAIAIEDPRGVMAAARAHGLLFGAAVSILDAQAGGQRSFGCFVRDDREFEDDEIGALEAYVRGRHHALAPPTNITMAELQALRLIKDGQRLKQIAYELGVTEGAVKQRLKSARAKLSAKTGAEAISRAAAFGLI
jgi:LuxR family transcriptional regulator